MAKHSLKKPWAVLRGPRRLLPGLSALATLAAPLTCAASSWYVDNQVATPGNGQSWSTAYRSMASIAWASVKAGDTVYISGGPSSGSKTYTEMWSVGSSGASGKPITITVDASNSSHNGTVVFDYDSKGDSGTGTGISISNQSYVTVSGNVGGQNRISIRNLRNILDRTNATCLGGSGDTSIVVDHVDFLNCNNGVRLWSGGKGTGSEVRNSSFSKIRGDVAVMLAMAADSWDTHKIHDNTIELLNNGAQPPGATAAYVGPDGIQPGDGVSVYANTIRVDQTSVYTSSQHTDDIQFGMARYLKVYGNEFVNVGDSVIDLGTWGTNIAVSDVWIYNNVFRIETKIDPYPQYIRLYANPGNISSLSNIKILNNLFLDSEPGWPVIDFEDYGGDPSATGLEIKNNIFYNTAGVKIGASAGFTASSFSFADNIYYPAAGTSIAFNGVTRTPSAWQAAVEASAKLGAPKFTTYVAHSTGNNLHLSSTDTVARDAGVSLSTYFNVDKDGVVRPSGAAWDIGPYEFAGAVSTVPPPTNLKVQ